MAQKQTEIDITDKHEVVLLHGVNQGRRTILARLDPPTGYNTIFWKSEELRDKYHKSVSAFLFAEEITITTTLMEGRDLTPDHLEWLLKWAPIEFENTLGVRKIPLKPGETYDEDPRKNWLRADVVRNFTQRGQLIARRVWLRMRGFVLLAQAPAPEPLKVSRTRRVKP